MCVLGHLPDANATLGSHSGHTQGKKEAGSKTMAPLLPCPATEETASLGSRALCVLLLGPSWWTATEAITRAPAVKMWQSCSNDRIRIVNLAS